MTTLLCWHRLRLRPGKRGPLATCVSCGVLVEECPCAVYRQPSAACEMCLGSGWVSVVRGPVAMFREYAGL